MKNKLKKIAKRIILSISKINISLYCLFSGKYKAEFKNVYNGMQAHNKQQEISPITFKLRRNLHRIEKGLSSNSPKGIFAESFIVETVKGLGALAKKEPNDMDTIKWGKDVLDLYYITVEESETIRTSFLLYQGIQFPQFTIDEKYVPYKSSKRVNSGVSYENFYSLCRQRRSIRWYESKLIERDIIEKCIEAALLSPSACNRQPFRFIIIDNKDKIKDYVSLPMGARTFKDNIPVIIFLIGDLSAYDDERDRHLIYVDGGLVTMSFLYALETVGLSSCVIHWPQANVKDFTLKQKLNLSNSEQCILCVSIGYADVNGKVPYSPKKRVDRVVEFI